MNSNRCFTCGKTFVSLPARIRHSNKCFPYTPMPSIDLSLISPNMVLLKSGLRGSCKIFRIEGPDFIVDRLMESSFDSFIKLMRIVRSCLKVSLYLRCQFKKVRQSPRSFTFLIKGEPVNSDEDAIDYFTRAQHTFNEKVDKF